MTRPPRSTADLLDRVQLTGTDRLRAQALLERADAIAETLYRLTRSIRIGVARVTHGAQRLLARLAKAA
jgi:hypothetical protein